MKLITLDDLDKLRKDKKKYFKKELPTSSQPKKLFIDGEFSKNNWNCGEATPIRKLIIDIDSADKFKSQYEFEVTYNEFNTWLDGYVFINLHYIDDYTFLTITVDGSTNIEINDGFDVKSEDFVNQYLVKIYKRRGSIETFTLNGQPIKRNEYLSLLHVLQSIGLIKDGK